MGVAFARFRGKTAFRWSTGLLAHVGTPTTRITNARQHVGATQIASCTRVPSSAVGFAASDALLLDSKEKKTPRVKRQGDEGLNAALVAEFHAIVSGDTKNYVSCSTLLSDGTRLGTFAMRVAAAALKTGKKL